MENQERDGRITNIPEFLVARIKDGWKWLGIVPTDGVEPCGSLFTPLYIWFLFTCVEWFFRIPPL